MLDVGIESVVVFVFFPDSQGVDFLLELVGESFESCDALRACGGGGHC